MTIGSHTNDLSLPAERPCRRQGASLDNIKRGARLVRLTPVRALQCPLPATLSGDCVVGAPRLSPEAVDLFGARFSDGASRYASDMFGVGPWSWARLASLSFLHVFLSVSNRLDACGRIRRIRSTQNSSERDREVTRFSMDGSIIGTATAWRS